MKTLAFRRAHDAALTITFLNINARAQSTPGFSRILVAGLRHRGQAFEAVQSLARDRVNLLVDMQQSADVLGSGSWRRVWARGDEQGTLVAGF